MRGMLAITGSLLSLYGCYGEEYGPESVGKARGQALAICDGSEGIRFGYEEGGGYYLGRDPEAFFKNLGSSFFYVRGDCHYVLSWGIERMREGELSSAQAEQLSFDVDYRTIDRRADRLPSGCSDGYGHIHGPTATLDCCNCFNTDPAISRFARESSFVEGAVTVATVERRDTTAVPSARVWPLTRPAATFAITHDGPPDAQDGVRIDDPDDAALLRGLRETRRETLTVATDPAIVTVLDGDLRYDAYIRDELPADMEAPVHDLLEERNGTR